ncbi:MAG: hypothetical protein CFH15_01316 [Alphaproteobacteria bacterium MarineAlpha5_Bin5]|nr:MAG: hypothetical protein CFH15_01316 [Alphaproteobacteria bacterium MarineAlpha5_Bin5]|tara:strand:- start:1437 stop:2720 length:1284 start_codon:yes stop_codon:yes gene_type:complete
MEIIKLTNKNLLLFLLILSIPFQFKITELNHFQNIYLTEFLFVLIVLITFNINFFKNIKDEFNYIDLCVIYYLISCIISFLLGSKYFISYEDIFGYFYLTFLYFYIKFLLNKKFTNLIITFFVISALVCSIIGLIGFTNSLFVNKSNFLLHFENNYPYFGEVNRIQSIMRSPSMMCNFLIIGVCASFIKLLKNKSYINFLIFIIIISCFTLSLTKSLICLILSLYIILISYSNFKRNLKITFSTFAIILVILIYFTISHFLISFEPIKNYNDNIFILVDKYYKYTFFKHEIFIYPTSYYYNKIASMLAFSNNPLFGVGIGNYNLFIDELKTFNNFPLNFPNWDPHSTYFGELAEKGILGIISLFLFFIFIFYLLAKNINYFGNDLLILTIAVLIFVLIDAISLDVTKFKHLWIYLAIISINLKKNFN